MKEHYPQRHSIPAGFLVPPERQPDFLWSPEEAAQETYNVARDSIDAVVEAGHGDKLAIVSLETGQRWTYRQLKEASDRLAGAFVELGVEIGDRLALRYPSWGEAIIAALGAWKAGAAIVPIPAQSRASQVEFYLNDTGARWVVVFGEGDYFSELEAALPAAPAVEGVVVGGAVGDIGSHHLLEDLMESGDPEAAANRVTLADDLSTVWHTGGTTGRPKATYHTHRRWVLAGRRLGEAWGAEPDQAWIIGIPTGNVAGILSKFLLALQHGATLVEPASLAGVGVLEAISEADVTHLLGVPLTLNSLADAVASEEAERLHSLERVFAPFLSTAAGDLYERWRKFGYHLTNPMGSSVMCTWFIGPSVDEETPAFAVGHPTSGHEARIVELSGDSAASLPAGEVGMFAVKGPSGLTYWNRHERQEREVRDGWTIIDDLGRQDEDGYLWFMGRLSNLIVTSGYKVVPGEVEEVLLRHPAVKEAVVAGVPDPLREQVVTAFVVLTPGVQEEHSLVSELQDWCKQEIAPYNYPRRVHFRDELPRDPVGKVQLRVLIEAVSDQIGDTNAQKVSP